MAVATSGEKQITIDGQKFRVRTQVVYQDGLGVPGTLSTTAPIRYVVQYKPEPFLTSRFINLGERDPTNKNNWIFTPAAGPGFQKALIANGPTSLTTSLDDATANALSASSGVTKQQAIQVLETAPNVAPTVVAPTQPTPPEPGTPAAPATPLTPENISTTIPDDDLSKKVDDSLRANLKYPITLSGSQDRIKFSVKQILGRQGIQNVANVNFTLGTRNVSDILGSVTLPIQPSISDSNGVDWGGANLNPIQAYAAGLSLNIGAAGGNITGEVARALNTAAEKFKDGLVTAGYKEAIQLYFAQEAVGAQNLLSRTSGAILNPNLELLFNGPTLRPFNFTFRLSPRSGPEAEEVKKIINWFKKAMAVKKAESEVFLKAPNIFDIEYQSGEDTKHQSLNKIKTCALLGCDVDYTPDGSYMTFNDEGKTMTSYQLTLRFSELDPIYNTDYADGHPIGY